MRRPIAAGLGIAVLCVSLARAECLAFGAPPCLTAHGERTWYSWAHRHEEPQQLFADLEQRLRPGEPIVIVAPQAVNETYWWRGMASYFLADHPIVALVNWRHRPRRPAPAQTLVLVRDGAIRVQRAAA